MNVHDSLQLLQKAEQLVDSKKATKAQLWYHFVPTLWGEGVVQRTSWKGRLSLWLNGNEDQILKQKKVAHVFAKALHQLAQDQQQISRLSTSFRVAIMRDLTEEWSELAVQQDTEPQLIFNSPELNHLRSAIQRKKLEQRTENQQRSLLARLGTLANPVGNEEGAMNAGPMNAGPVIKAQFFAALLDDSSTMSPECLLYFKDYLHRHPEYKSPAFECRSALLEDAAHLETEIAANFYAKKNDSGRAP